VGAGQAAVSVLAVAGDFFFQAEDGIRDFHVTGVQTCALPISCMSTSTAPERVGCRRRNSFARASPFPIGSGGTCAWTCSVQNLSTAVVMSAMTSAYW